MTGDRPPFPPFTLGPSQIQAEAAFSRLRNQAPVVAVTLPEGLRAWVVTRHAEARRVLRDPRFVKDLPAMNRAGQGWRGSRYAEDVYVAEGRHMLNSDGADHRRLRDLVSAHFAPRSVADRQAHIEQAAAELAERLAATASPDLMRDYAEPLPERLLVRILGLSAETGVRAAALTRRLGGRENPATAGMRRVYSDLVDITRDALCRPAEPGTVIATLQKAVTEGRASRRESLSTVLMLLGAGISSTAIAIGSGAARLTSAGPVLRTLLRHDAAATRLVEELLRHHPPFPFSPWRFTRAPVDVAGITIPANATVFVLLAAANRDPDAFDAAAEIRPSRPATGHLAFGLGPHYCIGAHLARLTTRIALRVLFDRLPDLRPAVPYPELTWRGLLFDRTMASFPVHTASSSHL